MRRMNGDNHCTTGRINMAYTDHLRKRYRSHSQQTPPTGRGSRRAAKATRRVMQAQITSKLQFTERVAQKNGFANTHTHTHTQTKTKTKNKKQKQKKREKRERKEIVRQNMHKLK